MSIPVELPDLASVIARYRFAYLMTSNARGAPHAVAVQVSLGPDGRLVVREAGRRTRENASARPAVGFVWPPAVETDYSLIVDGEATVAGEGLQVLPTRAVLHRPAKSGRPAPAEGCGSDCVELETRSIE